MKRFFLYVLFDEALPDILRYVGWTNNIEKRRKDHLNSVKKSGNLHKVNWIRSLLSNGRTLGCREIAEVSTLKKVLALEVETIAKYRAAGFNLTNATEGGEGAAGRVISDVTRRKLGNGNRGRTFSLEHRKFLSQIRKGKKHGPSGPQDSALVAKRIAAVRASGRYERRSEKERAILIARNKARAGQHASEKTCLKMSRAQLTNGNRPPSWAGKKHSEETRQKISRSLKLYRSKTIAEKLMMAEVKLAKLRAKIESE